MAGKDERKEKERIKKVSDVERRENGKMRRRGKCRTKHGRGGRGRGAAVEEEEGEEFRTTKRGTTVGSGSNLRGNLQSEKAK